MAQEEREIRLRQESEYRLRVPRIPRQSVDVFARDVSKGDYGLPANVVDALFAYAQLQQTLGGFDDLTFSPEFLAKLPDDFRTKLGQNLYPGIALADLEIPTTDKVALAELLTADALTESLSHEPIEVWVSPRLQKDLADIGFSVDEGLQQLDYSGLPLQVKQQLIPVMERQERQVHTILLARERFPEGVPNFNFMDMLSKKRKMVTFRELTDFDTQYEAAAEALDNPLQRLFGELFIAAQKKLDAQVSEPVPESDVDEPDIDADLREYESRPIDVEEEAKRDWWDKPYDQGNAFRTFKEVAAHLRPQYQGKTIYELLNATTPEEQEEVLAAFWRKRSNHQFNNPDDEGWIENRLYLRSDGHVEVHHWDDVYNDRYKRKVTGKLDSDMYVAMTDQALKWIREEREAFDAVRLQWEESGFDETQLVECTLAIVLKESLDSDVQNEINGLPAWFVEALNQEARIYSRLPLAHQQEPNIDDIFSLSFQQEVPTHNLLKIYFERSRDRLTRYARFMVTPAELFNDLGLQPTASPEEVKAAYRKIAKETGSIHTSSPADFDQEEWQQMNDRFISATRAYKALMRHQTGEARITTLGKLTTFFQEEP